MDIAPNLVNVVANHSRFTVDLRNTDNERLKQAEQELADFVNQLADREGIEFERRTLARFDPVPFDLAMVDRVESAAKALGHSVMRMPSGAGHDAQMLARICPTSMIFVPSADGISHNINEHTEPADLEAGVNVLLQVMLDLSE